MSKRDFSKGFQVRKSKGGNKVRFSVINQKRRIERRNRLEVFWFGNFSVELRFDSRERTVERIRVSKKVFSKGFQIRKSKGGNKVRFSVISQKSRGESGGGFFSSLTFR